MSYEVIAIAPFEKQFKKLTKKYPNLRLSLNELIKDLEQNPIIGTSIGRSFYKIRIVLPGKNSGKSGGARIITNVKITQNQVYLVSIYDKSETNNISNEQLDKLLITYI